MQEVTEQPDDVVVEQDTPDTEGDSTPSLEELLAQYDEETKPQEAAETKKDDNGAEVKLNKVLNYLEDQQRQVAEKQARDDLKTAVATTKEAGELDLPDDVIEAYIEHKARLNPKIRTAWLQRHNNKEGFNAVLKSLGRQLKTSLGTKADAETTSNVDAVMSAVSSTKTKTSKDENPDFIGMTPEEFSKWESKNL